MLTNSSNITVLLLENKQNNFQLLECFLERINSQQFTLVKTRQLNECLNHLHLNSSDVVLVNLNFDHAHNFEIQQQISVIATNIPTIFLTLNEPIKVAVPENYSTLAHQQGSLQLTNKGISPNTWRIQDCLIKDQLSISLLEQTIIYAIREKKTTDQLKQLQQLNSELSTQLNQTQKLFKTVVNSTSSLMWMIDTQENYTFLNQAWLSFTGQTLETGLEETWRDRIHPQDLAKCNQILLSAIQACQGFEIEYRLRRFDNSYRTFLNTAVYQQDYQGDFAGFLCSCLDITQRQKNEQKVVQQAETDRILTNITQNIHSSIELDIILQTAVKEVSQFLATEATFIIKIETDNQLTLSFDSRVINCSAHLGGTESRQLPTLELEQNFQQLSQGEIIVQNQPQADAIKNNNGDLATSGWITLLVPIITDSKLWGLLCVEHLSTIGWEFEAIKLLKRVAIQLGIAIKQAELCQKLEKLAVIDNLTQIANRRKFDQYMTVEWKRLTRNKEPLALILCDVDYFKLYNDTYGHQAGDRCLARIAQAINKVVKRPADLVARYGGEEFAVILPNTDAAGAKYLAQQIRRQIESLKIPHINSAVDLYVTLSLGVSSCIPDQSSEHHGLIAAADQGLYQAKELGRNRVVEFKVDMT